MRRVAYEQLWGPDEDEEDRVHGRAAHALTLERVQRLDSLRTLLDALLTPRMPLRDLTIVATTPVPAATVRGCEQHFSGLTALAFYPHDSPGPGGANSTEALQALQALLEQAPRAVKLRVGLENECGALFPISWPAAPGGCCTSTALA
ncbi:hypothetical protein COHA_008687 [Chlorella ohadii]|uniref:Uncharacterized protein n=1 Tax=Chlorella ohadii TaxID=2649997 RepID=A0AAD5DJU6_9CHLO|nr:hypothetical protein COHA_008687 [Chlorella ohadii]